MTSQYPAYMTLAWLLSAGPRESTSELFCKYTIAEPHVEDSHGFALGDDVQVSSSFLRSALAWYRGPGAPWGQITTAALIMKPGGLRYAQGDCI